MILFTVKLIIIMGVITDSSHQTVLIQVRVIAYMDA